MEAGAWQARAAAGPGQARRGGSDIGEANDGPGNADRRLAAALGLLGQGQHNAHEIYDHDAVLEFPQSQKPPEGKGNFITWRK